MASGPDSFCVARGDGAPAARGWRIAEPETRPDARCAMATWHARWRHRGVGCRLGGSCYRCAPARSRRRPCSVGPPGAGRREQRRSGGVAERVECPVRGKCQRATSLKRVGGRGGARPSRVGRRRRRSSPVARPTTDGDGGGGATPHPRRVAGLGGALYSRAFYVTLVHSSRRGDPRVLHIPSRPSMRQRRPTRTPRRPDRFSRRDPGAPWRRKGTQDGQERRPEHRDELHLAGYPRRQGQCHGVFS